LQGHEPPVHRGVCPRTRRSHHRRRCPAKVSEHCTTPKTATSTCSTETACL
jgi:hypothetical protein